MTAMTTMPFPAGHRKKLTFFSLARFRGKLMVVLVVMEGEVNPLIAAKK